ncbi:MAG: hypothetical protein ACK41Z_02200, partial [Sediminibacterium sp.]
MKKYLILIAQLAGLQSYAQDTIAKQDILSAAKLFDLQYNTKEVDTMYAGIKDNLKVYKDMHQSNLNNGLPMSLWQSPVVPGLQIEKKQHAIKWKFNTASASDCRRSCPSRSRV